MQNQERHHLENLRRAHQRRLQVLELQAAKLGYSTPPQVLTEIEDIRKELNSINLNLLGNSPIQQLGGLRETRVLFISADPTDTSRLRLGEELREIQEKLQLAQLRDYFKVDQCFSARPEDISQALLDVQPRIVHFSGHGTSYGALCIENKSSQMHPIDSDALASLFENFRHRVHCVILNACYSEIQAYAIAKYINYVIGMNKSIGDKAAIAFSVGFYQALGAGRSIKDSYNLGCVQIKLQNIPEHSTPILIHQESTNP